MSLHKLQIGFFLLITFLISVLAFIVFKPLFTVVFLSIILTIVFYPVHEYIFKLFNYQKTISSLISTALLIFIIVVPLSFVGTLIVQEAVDFYGAVNEGEQKSVLITSLNETENFINRNIKGFNVDFDRYIDISSFAQTAVDWIVSNVGGVFSGILKGAFSLFLLILATFYLLRDGDHFVRRTVELSPLEDGYDKKILSKIKNAINSVIRGHIIIGIIQGVLTGVGLAIFGVPSPVIWGFIAAVASLIPSIGTGLVMVPAVLFTFFTAGFLPAIGLTLWAAIAVGLVDNLLGPILIEKGIKIHPFIILLSVLGGLQFFGPIGFIAGPVTVALLLALLEIYPLIIKPLPKEK